MKKITLGLFISYGLLYANNTTEINNILRDSTNVNFNIKITHTDASKHMDLDGIMNNQDHSTLFGTVGIRLFPNTWKLDLSYTGTIGENLLFKGSNYDEFQKNLENYNGNYPINEKKKDTYWVNIYSKPLSSSIGDFGFGYTQIEQNVINEAFIYSSAKVLNIANSNNKATLLDQNNKYFKYNTKTSRLFITYAIPSKDSWYNGLGLSYGYETSNRAKVIEAKKSVVIKPDTTSQILTFGISKTLDEINTGIGFKTLTYGLVKSEHKYYDYDKAQNQKYSNNETQLDATLIFMFKPSGDKQFYITGGVMLREENDDESYYSESKLELGMIF